MQHMIMVLGDEGWFRADFGQAAPSGGVVLRLDRPADLMVHRITEVPGTLVWIAGAPWLQPVGTRVTITDPGQYVVSGGGQEFRVRITPDGAVSMTDISATR